MYQFIIDETYFMKRIKRERTPSVENANYRMEHILLSLALVENEFRKQHPDYDYQQWLTGGRRGLRLADYRRRYINALMLLVDGYKGVHGFNKVKDTYYRDKLDRGLIVPFTEKQLKKRSESVKSPSKDKDGKARASGKPKDFYYFFQKDRLMSEEEWIHSISEDAITMYNADPAALLIAKEEEEERHKARQVWLKENGFKPNEIEVAIEWLNRRDEGRIRGVQKELCQDMNITRGKLQYLIKRIDEFLKVA